MPFVKVSAPFRDIPYKVQVLVFIDQPCWLLLTILLVMTGVRP